MSDIARRAGVAPRGDDLRARPAWVMLGWRDAGLPGVCLLASDRLDRAELSAGPRDDQWGYFPRFVTPTYRLEVEFRRAGYEPTWHIVHAPTYVEAMRHLDQTWRPT